MTAIGGLWQQLGNGNDQQLAAERQLSGKKAEVADALEAGRQRVDEKTPDELSPASTVMI